MIREVSFPDAAADRVLRRLVFVNHPGQIVTPQIESIRLLGEKEGHAAVGELLYKDRRVEFDDAVLTHLQIVMVSKLRRREAFAMSWKGSAGNPDGRTMIWLDPGVPFSIEFDSFPTPPISRAWIEKLAVSAAGPTGLVVTDECGRPLVGRTRHMDDLPLDVG